MRKPVYLDYAATTPVAPEVATRMAQCLTLEGNFANPASRSHVYGWQAEELVEEARAQVAQLINADPREIVWTSGATEANNLALKGIAESYRAAHPQGGHIVVSAIEHKAVLDPVAWLEHQGFSVTRLVPTPEGIVTGDALTAALRADTFLVSIMQVNNELGCINDIQSLASICNARGILFHCDAAQSAGKTAIDVKALNVDLLSLSAHKFYGPKGVGALYVKRAANVKVSAQIHGGGHERGMRSGTLATHQIVGMGSAFALAGQPGDSEHQRIEQLAQRLRDGLLALPAVSLNGCATQRIPHTLNLCIDSQGFNSAALASELALSTTSACNSASNAPSHVLLALGLDENRARNSVRLSIGRFSTEAEVDKALEVFARVTAAASLALW